VSCQLQDPASLSRVLAESDGCKDGEQRELAAVMLSLTCIGSVTDSFGASGHYTDAAM
jgi:hypothetical protein